MVKRWGIFFGIALTIIGASAQNSWKVGFEAGRFPDSFICESGISGVDVDILREVARRKKVEFSPVLLPKSRLLTALDSGEIDCVGNGVALSEKTQKYAVISSGEAHFVTVVKTNSQLQTIADLKGRRVAIESDSPAYRICLEKADLEAAKRIIPTGSREESIHLLQKEKVDAVILQLDEVQELVRLSPGSFRIIDEKLLFEEYGIIFRQQDMVTCDAVLEILSAMADDGTLEKITAKYAHMPNPARKETASLKSSAAIDHFSMLWQLGGGLLVTIEIFFFTLLFALPLGQLVALCRMAKNPILSWISRVYISVMRGTPLMLQLLVWYFGPYYLLQVNLSDLSFCGIEYRFTAVIIGFVLNYAAYFAEIYRAGIESIPRGQYEAAAVLGYTKSQTFLMIILPQVVKRVVPPITNEVITLVKDTSLAFSLSVLEMFTIAKQVASAHATMMPFLVAGIFYYIFNFVVAYAMEKLEKSLNYYR